MSTNQIRFICNRNAVRNSRTNVHWINTNVIVHFFANNCVTVKGLFRAQCDCAFVNELVGGDFVKVTSIVTSQQRIAGQMIVQLLVCTLAAGLTVHWLWQRRFLYAASWRMRGPIAWPLVGNALLFWDIPSTLSMIVVSKRARNWCACNCAYNRSETVLNNRVDRDCGVTESNRMRLFRVYVCHYE